MSLFDKYFPLGLGTTRLPVNGEHDEEGVEKSVQIVVRALELGINYIDTSHIYLRQTALEVVRRAFARTNLRSDVTIKSRYGEDYTEADARKRIETTLKALDLPQSPLFCVWTIMSYAEFEAIMKSGGIYEGAEKAKKEGLIDHICASIHAPINDIIKIIESGVFEGLTISLNPLNEKLMKPVLTAAENASLDLAVMNPLGGGAIGQYPDYFAPLNGKSDENAIAASMRFAKAHKPVKIVLSGVSSLEQLEQNYFYITKKDTENPQERINRMSDALKDIKNFCTGCNYCAGCPVGIPVASIMSCRNYLNPGVNDVLAKRYNRTDKTLLESISLFDDLWKMHSFVPLDYENKCIRCRTCEKKCTQSLNICDALEDVYRRAELSSYSVQFEKERIAELLCDKGYKRVGIYPNTLQATKLMDLYKEFFGEADFECVFFNSDKKMRESSDAPVFAPEDIPTLSLDIILIVSYKYDDEIYAGIKPVCDKIGLKVEILYDRKNQLPWVFN